jgi:hypothetical protein
VFVGLGSSTITAQYIYRLCLRLGQRQQSSLESEWGANTEGNQKYIRNFSAIARGIDLEAYGSVVGVLFIFIESFKLYGRNPPPLVNNVFQLKVMCQL